MKTIGIMGGMGPLAAARLFERIVLLTKAGCDNEHIPMIIDNNTNIPDRTQAILNNGKSPVPELVRSALRLELMGADAIIIACNTAHYFYDDIVKFVKIPVINMVEETGRYIIKNDPAVKCAGLLATEGTCASGIYNKIFEKLGLELVIPEAEEQQHITDLIYGIKEGREDMNPENTIRVVSALKKRGAEVIVLGCTELPIAFGMFDICSSYVDSLEVLAMSAIAHAGKSIKYENIDKHMRRI
ncbi:MAG: amino acid racemase [Clostridiaceae bacterium]|jgi:aspartate racemase|nr:amino acid racemase [Clostridiaceae bacterium]